MNGELETLAGARSRLALGVGIVCLLLCLLGWFLEPRQFFISYLFAELVWLGVALGCMAFLMIHYLTGGKWGWPVRRMFEAAARTLPLVGLLFIPIFLEFINSTRGRCRRGWRRITCCSTSNLT